GLGSSAGQSAFDRGAGGVRRGPRGGSGAAAARGGRAKGDEAGGGSGRHAAGARLPPAGHPVLHARRPAGGDRRNHGRASQYRQESSVSGPETAADDAGGPAGGGDGQ